MLTIKQAIQTQHGLDDLPIRVGAGIIFMAHGSQKLFGWFGGYGLEATGQWMASIGLQPGFVMALLAGLAEFVGGLFLILGLLTRPTSIVLTITMLVAIIAVHFQHGFFMANNGYEFALALLVISAALAMRGAGHISADHYLCGAVK